MSENLLDPKPKAILHAYSHALNQHSNSLGLTIEELRALERIGSSITEGYLRLVQDAINSAGEMHWFSTACVSKRSQISKFISERSDDCGQKDLRLATHTVG